MAITDYCEGLLYSLAYGGALSPAQRCMLPLLHTLSAPYSAAIRFRNAAYDGGWARSKKVGIPVVSVGNISAGGTSKTPFVCYLAELLQASFQVAVLSRGYRAEAERLERPTIVSRGAGPEVSPEVCGDEPYWLAEKLASSIVIAGRSRVDSALLAEELGAQVILLDDGMQHRQLARDFEIVIVNARSPLGGGYVLPRGLLREPPGALRRADLIVVSKCESDEMYEQVLKQLSPWTDAPCIRAELKVQGLMDSCGLAEQALAGLRAVTFCGIADPGHFASTLDQHGVTVLQSECFSDHRRPSIHFLTDLVKRALSLGADCLICTEKDWVKLAPLPNLGLPVYYLDTRLQTRENPCQYLTPIIRRSPQ